MILYTLLAILSLFDKSCKAPAKTEIETVPSAVGVIKAVYLLSVILLKTLALAFTRVMSFKLKFLMFSEKVNVAVKA